MATQEPNYEGYIQDIMEEDMAVTLARIDGKLTNVEEKVERVHRVVIGNGEEGLVTRLALQHTQLLAQDKLIEKLCQELDSIHALRNKLIGAASAISFSGGALGAWVVKLLS